MTNPFFSTFYPPPFLLSHLSLSPQKISKNFYVLAIIPSFVFKIYLFIGCGWSSWLHTGFLYLQQAGATPPLVCGFLPAVVSLAVEQGSRNMGFSSCSAGAQQLQCSSLVAPWYVEASQARDSLTLQGDS